MPRTARWLGGLPATLLAYAGRQSLPVFVAGIVLSVIGSIIVRETGFDRLVQTAVVLGGIGLLLAFAALLDWQGRAARAESTARAAQLAARVEPSTN